MGITAGGVMEPSVAVRLRVVLIVGLPLAAFSVASVELARGSLVLGIAVLVIALIGSASTSTYLVRRTERLKAALISTLSHELRTPLTSIRGALCMLRADAHPASRQTLIDLAYRNSERLTRLVEDLLDLQRLELGCLVLNREEIALGDVIVESIETHREVAASRRVEIVVSEIPDVCIEADAARLIQVVSYLLSNALKYSPAGSGVELDVTATERRVTLAVTNHGPPIPASFRKQVFMRFTQADSSDRRLHGGAGLGLALAREIVELHGGTIGCRSDDLGTTFSFELPRLRRSAA